MEKKFRINRFLLILAMLPISAAAENLTDSSLLLVDKAAINGGKSFSLAAPPKNRVHQWQTRTPHALKEEIIVSFPFENGILLDRIQARSRAEYPQKVEVSVRLRVLRSSSCQKRTVRDRVSPFRCRQISAQEPEAAV